MARQLALAVLTLWSAVAAPTTGSAAAPAPNPNFDVWEFRVLGNSVLPVAQVEAVVYPFLGSERSLKDVDAARAALEALYHEKGYGTVFVDVPEQDVDDGVVRLKVIEGRLGAVHVTGARYFSGRAIRKAVPEATAGSVPYIPALQDQVRAVNGVTPDRVVVPVLKAGAEPGTVDLSLNVEEHPPAHVSVEVNNAHTADTTPDRLLVEADFSNAFGRLDNASLQYQTAPQRTSEVEVFAANYAARLGDHSQLAFFYIRSKSDVAAIGTLDVLGNGSIYGARWINSLPAQSNLQRSLTVGLDWKDFGQDVRLIDQPSLSSPVRYLNVSLAADVADRGEHLTWAFELMPSFGTRGALDDPAQFAGKCFQCRPNYFYVRGTGRAEYRTSRGWSFSLRGGGQKAMEPVIANEQYSVGGVQTVRGYLEASALGDNGWSGGMQLGAPALSLREIVKIGLYVFLDDGRVASLEPLSGQPRMTDLRSAGVGLDFSFGRHVSGFLVWADPLLKTPQTARGDSRLLFSLRGNL